MSGLAVDVDDLGRRWRQGCAAGPHDLARLVGGWRQSCAWRSSDGEQAFAPWSSLKTEAGRYPRSAALTRRRFGWSARCAISMVSFRSAYPITRPWLDHGRWPRPQNEARYEFLPSEGEGLHQIAVGPVHAGIIEPGHFRFTANGETVVRLEQRLGYVHKGVEALFAGADIARGAADRRPHVGRQHGSLCLGLRPRRRGGTRLAAPPRAMLVSGRHGGAGALAHHISDVGAICNDASVLTSMPGAPCSARTSWPWHAWFGHRLMMDRIVPGGVSADLSKRRHRPGPRPAGAAGQQQVPKFSGSTNRCRRCRIAPLPPASFRPSCAPISPPAASSAARPAAPSTHARISLCALCQPDFEPQDAHRR